MKPGGTQDKTTAKEQRDLKRADALRKNLRRRKQQSPEKKRS